MVALVAKRQGKLYVLLVCASLQVVDYRVGVHLEYLCAAEVVVAVGEVDFLNLSLQVGIEPCLLLGCVLVGKTCIAGEQLIELVVYWPELVVPVYVLVDDACHCCGLLVLAQ